MYTQNCCDSLERGQRNFFLGQTTPDFAMTTSADQLVLSADPDHPANLIPSLCAKFWTLGWVTGTGGGASIRDE